MEHSVQRQISEVSLQELMTHKGARDANLKEALSKLDRERKRATPT